MKNHPTHHHTQLHPSPTRSSQNRPPSTRRRRSSSLSSIRGVDHGSAGFRSEGEMEYVGAHGERRIKKRCRKHVALSSPSTSSTLGVPFSYQPPITSINPLAPAFAFPSLPSEFNLPTTTTTRHLPNSTTTQTPSTPPSFSPTLFPSSSSYSSDPSSHSPLTPPTHATTSSFDPLSSPSPLILEDSAMDLDGPPEVELDEIKRLHRAAFEDLRKTTERDGEGFVERLRRWESSSGSGVWSVHQGVGLGVVRGEEEMGGEGDDELDVNFELGEEREGEMREGNVVDRLALQLGGEELEDYSAVREYQKAC